MIGMIFGLALLMPLTDSCTTTTTSTSTTTTTLQACNANCPTSSTGSLANMAAELMDFATTGTVTTCATTGGVVTGQTATLQCTDADTANANVDINAATVAQTTDNGLLDITCDVSGWMTTTTGVEITSVLCI